jgi:hypothetical protein
MDARFMVDYDMFRRFHPGNGVFSPRPPWDSNWKGRSMDPWPRRLQKDEDLSAENALLMPDVIHGFDLVEKEWGKKPSTTSCK